MTSPPTAKRQARRSIVHKKKKSCTPQSVNVTDKSPPEAILRASWRFLTCFQFLSLFAEQLCLPHFSIDMFEKAMLFPCPSMGLSRRMSSMLADEFDMGCTIAFRSRSKGSPKQLIEDVLLAVLKASQKHCLTDNTIHEAVYDFIKNDMEIELPRDQFIFWNLDVLARVRTLKGLIDAIDSDQIQKWKAGMVPEEMRLAPIGEDSIGWTYWTFGYSRLYRELPMNMAQKKTSPMLTKTEYTFELLCHTADEWREYVANYTSSARRLPDKILAARLGEIATVVVGRLEALEAGRARLKVRMNKAQMLDMIPRKRSRRLEEKEDEVNKRLKAEELEQQQQALAEYEQRKEEKRLREEQEQDEQMIRHRENELRDTVAHIIDDRLNKEIGNATDLLREDSKTGRRRASPVIRDTPKIMFLRKLRGVLMKGASLDDCVAKMQGWATLLEGDDAVKIVPGPDPSATLTLHHGLKVETAVDAQRGDLTSPVLKNILRIYLTSLSLSNADMRLDLQTIKKKLLLDQYKQDEGNLGLENFIEDLDLAIPQRLTLEPTDATMGTISLRQHAAQLLTRIFENV